MDGWAVWTSGCGTCCAELGRREAGIFFAVAAVVRLAIFFARFSSRFAETSFVAFVVPPNFAGSFV
jgi:hypothetical protein